MGLAPAAHGPSAVRIYPVARNQRPPEKPVLKHTKKGNYRVMQPWQLELNGRRWLIPAGYSSNGITATAKLKTALGDGVDKPETWAAVFHDWLFTQPGVTRGQADSAFHELLLAYGVPPAKAQMMYNSVAAYSLFKAFR